MKALKHYMLLKKNLSFDITLGSMPLNLINKKIMNQHFFQAKILLKSMGLFYNNRKIKNLMFVKFFNLKPLDED